MFEPDFLNENGQNGQKRTAIFRRGTDSLGQKKTDKNGQNGQKRTVIFRRGTDSFEKIEIWNTSGVNRSRHLPIRTTLASEYYVTFEKIGLCSALKPQKFRLRYSFCKIKSP